MSKLSMPGEKDRNVNCLHIFEMCVCGELGYGAMVVTCKCFSCMGVSRDSSQFDVCVQNMLWKGK